MLKYTLNFFLLITTSLSFFSCANSPFGKKSNLTKEEKIISIDGENISKENFVYLYEKNYINDSTYYSQESVDNYLDLFIKFKLKVAEAVALGYDTLPDFQSEYKMYLHQLEEPYLTESVFNDSLVKQAYERQKIEVNASHLLIKLEEDASPEDTLAAYNKILSIKKELQEGKDFEELAFQYSEDPSAKRNKGNLGYFTSLQMVYPFEEAAFNTEIDSVSDLIKTRFGYHLLKVNDKRERFGNLQVQHIMINSGPRDTKEKQEIAKQKVFSIYDSLQNGGDWNALCANFSDDKRSSQNNGILPPVNEVRFPPQFLEGVSSLQKVGEIAQPVKTDFGWHIIRLYKKEPVAPYETMYPGLVTKVKRDSRSQTSRKDFIKKLKKDNSYTVIDENKTLAYSLVDSSYLTNEWKKSEEIDIKTLKKKVFTLKGKDITVNDFLDYLVEHEKTSKNDDLEEVLEDHFNKYSELVLLEVEKENLPEKYPEYKHLAQEYQDGLLLFRVMEDCVWNKASQDADALEAYYETNKENYMWDTRAVMSIYNTGSKQLMAETIEMLDSNYYQVYPSDVSTITFKKNSSYLYKSRLSDIKKSAEALKHDKSLFVLLNVEVNKGEYKSMKSKRLQKIVNQYVANGISEDRIKSNFEEGAVGVVDVKYYSTNTADFVQQKNSNNNLSVSFKEGTFVKDEIPHMDHLKLEKGRYTFEENNRFFIVEIKDILAPSVKSLDECKGSVIANYQEYLEKNWVEELHHKHNVMIDSIQLNSLYQKEQSI
ncbi:peptidylprolyl isomerase [Flammeovirga sp. EKP202]|uniref:peptidylprolyl isomerase n=1 Tax=Flammeovirga sp. EKP202 TaxID=2770592 RepID=UPI00165FA12C|nr:peptidylprolyl isomerase [Flammeovirga sp. EKP202]MBD0404620.1 peptidylprolyl isomerase [Flammeovirga sp. EKP202]